jgi:hypothetical protein
MTWAHGKPCPTTTSPTSPATPPSDEAIETRGCIIAAEPGHLIATYGVEDLIIVQSKDATLVCRKEDAENVKKIVERIEERGLEEYL